MRVCYIGKGYEDVGFPKKVIEHYSIGKLLKANKSFNPDILHFTELPLSIILAKLLTKKKIVLTLDDFPSSRIKKFCLSFCDGVIVTSKYHHSRLKVKENKKVVIPIPVEAGGGPKNRELILDCTGSKNMERAMDLIGDELPKYVLTRDIMHMGECEAVFVGSHQDIRELQKAMSMGKIVIALDKGGLSEYVAHKKNGMLTEDEPSKIANKITQVFKDDRLRHRIVERAKRDARRWDHEHVRRKLNRFYTYVLES